MNANVCGAQGFRSLISSRQGGGKERGTERRGKERRATRTTASFQYVNTSQYVAGEGARMSGR